MALHLSGAGVASVNQLVVPAGTPIRLKLTSASVMNSFFVPQLAGQIYTMHGMTTRLNMLAHRPGTYQGLSSQFSGDGFSDMRFKVIAMSPADFAAWAKTARTAPAMLDAAAYGVLLRPSSKVPPTLFGRIEPTLFDQVSAGRSPSPMVPAEAQMDPDMTSHERH
jgi:cytochrome o ubiquinol oxidase subunit 2